MSVRKRQTKSAKRGYTYQVRVPYLDACGNRQVHSKSGFKSLQEARNYEKYVKREFQKESESINKALTINDVYIEFMDKEGDAYYAPATKQYFDYTFHSYIEPSIGTYKIYKVRYQELQDFFDTFDKLPTAKNAKKVMKAIYKYAIKVGYIKQNYMNLIKLQLDIETTKTANEEIITEEQLVQLIQAVTAEPSKYAPNYIENRFNFNAYGVAMYIAYYTGLRISEVLGLKKEDVDLVHDLIYVRRKLSYQREKKISNKLKNEASKAILPLAKPLKELLINWFEYNPHDLVVCNYQGQVIVPSNIYERIRNVTPKLGINFRFHMLRHMFTTRLINNGMNPTVVKELVRHSDISTTFDVYTHVKEDTLNKAINKGDQNVD